MSLAVVVAVANVLTSDVTLDCVFAELTSIAIKFIIQTRYILAIPQCNGHIDGGRELHLS